MRTKQRILAVFFCGAVLGSLATWCAPAAWAQEAAEFQTIFNGRNLDGWDGDEKFWSVKDGAITGQTKTNKDLEVNTYLIWQGGKLVDFELRIKFRLVGGNSGVNYRSRELSKFVVGGYQADFDEDEGGMWIGVLYDAAGRLKLADRGTKVVIRENGDKEVVGETTPEAEILAAYNKRDWNEYTIIARGNRLVQKLNGLTTVDVIDEEKSKAHTEGILALQLHPGDPMTVQFKDIRLKTFE